MSSSDYILVSNSSSPLLNISTSLIDDNYISLPSLVNLSSPSNSVNNIPQLIDPVNGSNSAQIPIEPVKDLVNPLSDSKSMDDKDKRDIKDDKVIKDDTNNKENYKINNKDDKDEKLNFNKDDTLKNNSKEPIESFTAEDAKNLYESIRVTEIKTKVDEEKIKCIEGIRKAIILRKTEYRHQLSIIANDKEAIEEFEKYFSTILRFTIYRSACYPNTCDVQWINEKTRMLIKDYNDKKGIEDLKIIVKRKEYINEFTVYHAILLDFEIKENYINAMVRNLLAYCIKKIQETIKSRQKTFLFRIAESSFVIEYDHSIIYDSLVEELEKRKFRVTERSKRNSSMLIHCLPMPEITVESQSSMSSGVPLSTPTYTTSRSCTDSPSDPSSTSTMGQARSETINQPRSETINQTTQHQVVRERLQSLLNDLCQLVAKRTQWLLFIRMKPYEQKSDLESLSTIENNMTEIINKIVKLIEHK